jgi:hypothetical protein
MARNSRTYWKQPKRAFSLTEGRRQLELMFKFANLNLAAIGAPALKDSIVAGYLELLNLAHNGSTAITDATYLERLQAHLRKRLLRIIEDSKQLWEMPQWSLSGRLQLSLHGREGRFIESFVPHRTTTQNSFFKARGLTDLRLYELIRDIDLQPKRFRQCPQCNKLFYQATARPKEYCSATCAGTVRQARFRKRGRGGQWP